MTFNTSLGIPTIQVRTYSTYYKKLSIEQPNYAEWYKHQEQPEMSDEAFMKADHFDISLSDFKRRFGEPRAE